MRYRRLGASGVKVSEVALGGWLTQGRSIDDQTTAHIVRRAFDLGINFFDTADVYNNGEAEKSLAKAIKEFRRIDLFIATKCYFPMTDRPNDQGLSRKHIMESVHDSLRRLETDTIDLMQFHRFDPHTPLEESIRAVTDLIAQGKVHYWGVSMWSAAQISEAVHIARQMNVPAPVSNQPKFNMFDRSIEHEVLPTCDRLGLGQVVFSPLAQGVLTGKYRPGQPVPEGSRGADAQSNMWMGHDLREESLRRVVALEEVAKDYDLTVGQFALAWCLRHPGVNSVIVGATRIEQIEENAHAGVVELPGEAWDRAEAILTA